MHASALLPLVAIFPVVLGQLNTLAKARGLKYFGSATDNNELTDSQYTSILSNTSQFGQITPGNTQKWVYTEPSQNSFSWSQGDAVTSFAEKNGQLLRCMFLFIIFPVSKFQTRRILGPFGESKMLLNTCWRVPGHNLVWYNELPNWSKNSHFPINLRF